MQARPAQLSTLDLLRAIATVDVVVCHLLGVFQRGGAVIARMGTLAVLLFFVHTCYVLMLSLERQHSQNSDRVWTRFMIRRCFRIYPLPLAVLAVILIFQIPSRMVADGSFVFLHLGKIDVLSNLLLATNLTRSRLLLEPMWSLPFEMQMYLMLPALFLLARRSRNVRPLLLAWAGAVVLALLHPLVPRTGRLGIIEYLPCFLPGVIAYKLAASAQRRVPFFVWGVVLLGVGVLCAAVPGGHPWMSAWIACMIVGTTVPFMAETRSRLAARVSSTIARYSYGCYLTHYFAIWAAFRANHFAPAMQWAVFAVLAISLPAIVYHAIEAPFVQIGRKWSAAPAAKLEASYSTAGA